MKKVLLRADASPRQGTGHVMRCLTLSEELIRQGNEVILMTNSSNVGWLEQTKEAMNVKVVFTQQHQLSMKQCLALSPDLVIVDSYEVPAEKISKLVKKVPVLAIIDGNTRGIEATKYLDQNLGAELAPWPNEVSERLLAGSKFALIRESFFTVKRSSPWLFQKPLPHIVAVIGGSDPTGTMVEVSRALRKLYRRCTATVIVSDEWLEPVSLLLGQLDGYQIIAPTSELPRLLASADIAISASGTSSAEICYLGIPSILIAVVENQDSTLRQMTENKLVLGINLNGDRNIEISAEIESMVIKLLEDNDLREQLSNECVKHYDGLGKVRVVKVLEKILKNADCY